MNRNEYKRLIKETGDPYSVWIRDKEIKRSPEGFAAPEGYLVFSDKDGETDPKAGAAFREYGAFSGEYDFIYTDEDEIDAGVRHDPYFKPGFSPDTLESFYYPGGLTVVRRDLIDRAKEMTGYPEGSLEFLRICGDLSKKPLHIPEVLYHAFHHHGYGYSDAGISSCDEKNCKIAVIILSKDHPDLLKQCVSGVLRAAESESADLKCLVIDNGSSPENTEAYGKLSKEYGFDYLREETDFIYSKLCNLGAEKTESDLILFLNDDIEIPEGTVFLKRMADAARGKRTGAVGCKLLYPGGKLIQHCGITLLKSGASHKLSGYEDSADYYRGVNRIKRNVFAVTGACLMLERKKFKETGGFDEALSIAYTDVDLCSALLEKGYYNVCMNDICLIHHESLSRKSDDSNGGKFERLLKEREYYYKKYSSLISYGDPWYSSNLTDTGLDYTVNIPSLNDRIPFMEELSVVGFTDGKDTVVIREGSDTVRYRKTGESGKVLFSIDTCENKISDAQCHRDFTEISGWAFVHREPGYRYDISVLIKDGDRWVKTPAGRIEREDIVSAFPKERDILLQGFSVKIKRSALTRDISRDKVFLILDRRDIFGKKRGYITV